MISIIRKDLFTVNFFFNLPLDNIVLQVLDLYTLLKKLFIDNVIFSIHDFICTPVYYMLMFFFFFFFPLDF